MKLKIIHIIRDEKFSIPMVKKFESDPRLENRAILICKDCKKLKYIENKSLVEFVHPDRVGNILKMEDYDAVFFHSLMMPLWKLLLCIPKEKSIIWWMWGHDFYTLHYGVSPFVRRKLYKHATQLLVKNRRNVISYWAKYVFDHLNIFKYFYYSCLKKKIIARIDFFNPVLPYEFDAMKKYPSFRAQLFYYKRAFPDYSYNFSNIENGEIFLGNSASYSNNHADILNKLNTLPELCNTIYIPLSYGDGGSIYVNQLKTLIKESNHHYIILSDFIPKEEYFSMVSKSPFMITGVLRQQAMGNIHFALRNAVKVFFFKDSDVYKYLKSKGYIVFAIEDIDEHSFTQPLTYEEGLYNFNLNKTEIGKLNKTFDVVVENLLKKKRKILP